MVKNTKICRRRFSTSSNKAIWGTFFIFLILSIAQINLVSSFEWDNVKSYDELEKKVTITNALNLGSTIAEAQLKTPQTVNVIDRGDGVMQKVAEFEVDLKWDSYPEALQEMKFYDINREMREFEREFEYRIGESYIVEKPITEQVCKDVFDAKNGTQRDCTTKIIGYKNITKWNYDRELNSKDLYNGVTRIAIYTDVKKGDYVEWIPTMFGEDINEWATWTSNFDDGLIAYYNLDESSGDAIDVFRGKHNGTWTGDLDYGEAGIVGTAMRLANTTSPEKFVISDGTDWDFQNTDEMTFNYWIKGNGVWAPSPFELYKRGSGDAFSFYMQDDDDHMLNWKLSVWEEDGTRIDCHHDAKDINITEWTMWTFVANGSDIVSYINGSELEKATYDGTLNTESSEINVGVNSYIQDFDYFMDEVGFWNRSLTADEISDLYNDGSGITYGGTEAGEFNVELLAPANDTLTPSDTLNFSARLNATGIFNFTNATFYIWNSSDDEFTVNTTSLSGNGSTIVEWNNTGTFTSDTYNWNVYGCFQNESIDYNCTWSYNGNYSFEADIDVPVVILTSPPSVIDGIHTIGDNLTLNWSVVDSNLDTCWYEYGYESEVEANVTGVAGASVNVTSTAVNEITYGDPSDITIDTCFVGCAGALFKELTGVTGYWSEAQTSPICDYLAVDSRPDVYFEDNIGNYVCLKTQDRGNFRLKIIDSSVDGWVAQATKNDTVTCADNNVSFSTIDGEQSITFYANDTLGNSNSSTINWSYEILNYGTTYNSSTVEGASEGFTINVSANSSLTSATLNFNGTAYSGTDDGGLWSTNFYIPLGTGVNEVNWSFDYAGNTYYTSSFNVTVESFLFGLCNATFNQTYINFTFKDEEDDSNIVANIPTSTFEYWTGTRTINKTLTYINTTENAEYSFCFKPTDQNVNVDIYMQYKNNSDYPQRIYNPDPMLLTNTTFNKTLYLLSTADGQYVTFQVITAAEQPIENVEVTASRQISGSSTIISEGTTGAAGTVTFWLNPNFQHTLLLEAEGYEDVSYSLTPSNTEYTITMGTTTTVENDYGQGVSYSFSPSGNFLDENTLYNFSFTFSSTYWSVDNYSASLYYGNDSLIDTESDTTSTGGTLNFNNINTTNSSSIYMEILWDVDGNITYRSRTWIIESTEGRSYSIWNFFENLDTHLTAGLFGIGDFGRTLLSFIIIVVVVGGMSYRYGIRSEASIMGMIFGVVLALNILGLIPAVSVGDLDVPEYFPTVLAAFLLIVIVWREELR